MLAVDTRISERLPASAAARRKQASDCENLTNVCARANGLPAAVSYAKQSLARARAAREIAGVGQPFYWDFAISLYLLATAQERSG
jgi:hypothetical protein